MGIQIAWLLGAQASTSDTAVAQAAPATREAAMRLRDQGDFAGASRILRDLLSRNASDGEARRLLAETLYWMHDVRGAREVYEEGLVRQPDDWMLRLQFGRMLVETLDARRARDVLGALARDPRARASALTLLGTLAYWTGDLVRAERHFAEALRADSTQEAARRQLHEIEAIAAPWISVGAELRRDDQPMNVAAGELRAGWFVTPHLSIAGRLRPRHHDPRGRATATIASGDVVVAHHAPALRLESELAVGGVRRSFVGAADATGSATVGVRLPRHVTVRAHASRSPYLATVTSLVTPVMATAVGASWHLEHPRGWLGEGAARQERFGDGNAVTTAYAWVLAPVVHTSDGGLQLGYALAMQDADSSRLALPLGGATPLYDPYFTPEGLRIHSVVGAARWRASPRADVRVNGSYGVRATDQAPYLDPTAGTTVRFYPRTFRAHDVRASLGVRVSDRVQLTVTGEHGRMIFYSWSALGIELTHRFPRLGVLAGR